MIQRAIELNDLSQMAGTVIYWMSRDQRVDDNWALLYAQSKALESNQGLMVVFCKFSNYLGSTKQQDSSMMEGLHEVYGKLKGYNIPFVVLEGNPVENITTFLSRMKAGLLVTDFNSLKISREWKTQVAQRIDVRFVEVDGHNIIPCFIASNKQEYAAYTFRKKAYRKLDDFLTDFPEIVKHPFHVSFTSQELASFNEATQKVFKDKDIKYAIKPGEAAAKEHYRNYFRKQRLRTCF